MLERSDNFTFKGNIPEMTSFEYDLVSELGKFSDVVKSSADKYEPSFITRYALDLASAFNKFYINCKIIGSPEDIKVFRLALVKSTKTVLTNALTLLGIETVEKM